MKTCFCMVNWYTVTNLTIHLYSLFLWNHIDKTYTVMFINFSVNIKIRHFWIFLTLKFVCFVLSLNFLYNSFIVPTFFKEVHGILFILSPFYFITILHFYLFVRGIFCGKEKLRSFCIPWDRRVEKSNLFV